MFIYFNFFFILTKILPFFSVLIDVMGCSYRRSMSFRPRHHLMITLSIPIRNGLLPGSGSEPGGGANPRLGGRRGGDPRPHGRLPHGVHHGRLRAGSEHRASRLYSPACHQVPISDCFPLARHRYFSLLSGAVGASACHQVFQLVTTWQVPGTDISACHQVLEVLQLVTRYISWLPLERYQVQIFQLVIRCCRRFSLSPGTVSISAGFHFPGSVLDLYSLTSDPDLAF